MTTDGRFTFEALTEHLRANLPDYARPRFVRLCRDLPVTGTFKLSKSALMRDGLSAATASGSIWLYDRKQQAFTVCDAAVMERLQRDEVRL